MSKLDNIKGCFKIYSADYKLYYYDILLEHYNFDIQTISQLLYADNDSYNNDYEYVYICKLKNNKYTLIQILENTYEEIFDKCYIDYHDILYNLIDENLTIDEIKIILSNLKIDDTL